MIFKTEKLITRQLLETDLEDFFDLMGNANVMNPIPLMVLTQEESNAKLQELLKTKLDHPQKKVFAICEKANNEFIGFCALIKNNENEDEIAYRLREKFWSKGYGSEIAKGLIDYCFDVLKLKLLTADVNIENTKSVRILEKLMTPVNEFYNEKDKCTDRRYKILKINHR